MSLYLSVHQRVLIGFISNQVLRFCTTGCRADVALVRIDRIQIVGILEKACSFALLLLVRAVLSKLEIVDLLPVSMNCAQEISVPVFTQAYYASLFPLLVLASCSFPALRYRDLCVVTWRHKYCSVGLDFMMVWHQKCLYLRVYCEVMCLFEVYLAVLSKYFKTYSGKGCERKPSWPNLGYYPCKPTSQTHSYTTQVYCN